MAVITSISAPRTETAAMLMATLAFETIVDAIIHFDVRVGMLPSAQLSPIERQEYRARVVQLLNERSARIDGAAIAAATEAVHGRRAEAPAWPTRAAMGEAISAYREHLRTAPVPGIGVLR